MTSKPTYEELAERVKALELEVSKLREADRQLERSEAFLDSIIHESPHAMWISDDKGTLIEINRACCDLLNISKEEVVGKYNVLKDDIVETQGYLPLVKSVFEEGKTATFELQYESARLSQIKLKRTASVILDVTIFPIKDRSGKVTNAIIQHKDITKQIRAERALKESEKRFRELAELLPEAVFEMDLTGRITFANRYASGQFGYSTEDFERGVNAFDMIVAEDRQRALQKVEKVLRGEQVGLAAYQLKTKSESVFPAILGLSAILHDGKPVGLRGFVIDITEQKKIEEALRESEENYRNLVENINDALYATDDSGVVTYISTPIKAMSGYGPSEIIGRSFREFLHGDDVPRVMDEFQKVLSGEIEASEYRIVTKSGETRWVRSSSLPILVENRPVGLQGMVTDITERKQAEEDRDRLQAQLLQAQKMESVGRLAGGVAHDFNNMLSVILGNAELSLSEVGSEGSLHTRLEEVLRAAKRAADITRQLLAFARRQTISPKVLDLNETVEGMLKMLRRLIGEDIDLAWQPDTNLWPVKMDPAQIDQILANLCVNARDAISGVGKVTIETKNVVLDDSYCDEHNGFVPGCYVLLAVSDDGSGMNKEILANIFEPFFTTKGPGEGTGLGLSTVYGIVKQNQGFINVYSEPGKGATFKIYLPRHEGEAEAAPPETTDQVPRGLGETILIVEDEPLVLAVGKKILENLGYTVLAAGGAAEALEMARGHSGEIHLLLTDVVMPEMSGKDVAARMTKIRPNMKILFMSGYTANVIAHREILEKGVQFIQKPFSHDSLARKVREALDKAGGFIDDKKTDL